MELTDYRNEIDRIDQELIRLFTRRMEISAEIGRFKQENGLPVHDPRREEEKLETLTGQAPKEMEGSVRALYERIFELSRSVQQ